MKSETLEKLHLLIWLMHLYHLALKYPSFDAANAGAATDPIFFIRHAEMVLIIAEAAAEQGDFG